MSGQLTGSYLFFYAEKNRKTEQIRMNTELLKAKYFLQKGLKKKKEIISDFPCKELSSVPKLIKGRTHTVHLGFPKV